MRSFIKRITPEGLKKLYRSLRGRILGAAFGVFGRLPIRPDRVVLENVWGYGDNPKSIALALRKQKKKLDIIFIAGGNRHVKVPKGIRLVPAGSLRAVYYLSTARVWVDCNHKPYYVRKRNGQFYMQTWHGSLPLKRIEKDAKGLGAEYLEEAAFDTGLADVFLSDSEFCNDVYRHAFGYKGRIAMTGSPRLDTLLKNAKRTGGVAGTGASKRRTAIHSRLGLGCDKAIALYAPTFRGGGEDAGPLRAFDAGETLKALKASFGKDFVLLVKLHPLAVSHGCGAEFWGGEAKDVSSYPNIYELLEVTDVLITDYSNTMFEFSYTGRPCFLFAPDSDRYARERGMYFVYDRLPFPIARDSAGLARKIKSYDSERYATLGQAFYRDLGVREDGHASRRAARIIMNEINKGL